MLRHLLIERRARLAVPDRSRGLYLFQFDDFARQDIRSAALGRRTGYAPMVELILDPYFFYGKAFAELRALAERGALPAWEDRADVLFWRGRGSHNGTTATGAQGHGLFDVPRISLARRLRTNPHADAALIGPWMQEESDEEAIAIFQREGIYRPAVPMAEHARYKYQLDIDGVGNAWSLIERFLCGSCVLKVASPFEMWFYNSIAPWKHFVPVAADAGDIDEKIDWCLTHADEARAIAQAGQAFALSLTLDRAMTDAIAALSRCRLALD